MCFIHVQVDLALGHVEHHAQHTDADLAVDLLVRAQEDAEQVPSLTGSSSEAAARGAKGAGSAWPGT